MRKTKKATFVYEAFGFPVKLIKVPMRKVIGEWVIDVDFRALEKAVLRQLIHKSTTLTGPELRFIRKFFQMTTTEFGKLFGISHVAVLKWEGEKTHAPISADIYIRLYVLDQLHAKDKEFRALYVQMTPQSLVQKKKTKTIPLSINIEDELESA